MSSHMPSQRFLRLSEAWDAVACRGDGGGEDTMSGCGADMLLQVGVLF